MPPVSSRWQATKNARSSSSSACSRVAGGNAIGWSTIPTTTACATIRASKSSSPDSSRSAVVVSGFEDRSFMYRRDHALVHAEPAVLAARAKLPRCPLAHLERRLVDFEIDRAAIEVDRDDVALVEPGERPAGGCLRRGFSDDQTVIHQARELPLRDHGDVIDQARPIEREDDGRRHRHAWPAADAQPTQHDDVARADGALLD